MEEMAAIDRDLAAVKRELNKLRMQVWRRSRLARAPENPNVRFIAGLLHSLKEEVGLAVIASYVLRACASAGSTEWNDDALHAADQCAFDEASLGERLRWRYPRNAHDEVLVNAAYRFVAEYRLVAWILHLNMNVGVAPTSLDALAKYARSWPWRGRPWIRDEPEHIMASKPRTQRKQAERFRARWGLKIGALKMESFLRPGECERKVRRLLGVTVARKTSHAQGFPRKKNMVAILARSV